MLCNPNILHNLIKLTNLFCGVEQELRATTEVNIISNRNLFSFPDLPSPATACFVVRRSKKNLSQQRLITSIIYR